jgi:hypothetical protein
MEPEGFLTCSKGPSAGPYPEPDQFIPYLLSTHLGPDLPSCLFPTRFPTNIGM